MSATTPLPSSDSKTAVPLEPAIEKHLLKLAQDMVLACNNRQWDPETYPWTHMSPEFRVGPTFATIPSNMDLIGFLKAFSALYADKPEYYTSTISSTAQSEKPGEAQVYSNFQNMDFTPGVIRYSIGLWEFREVEGGKWLCVWYRSLPGPTG